MPPSRRFAPATGARRLAPAALPLLAAALAFASACGGRPAAPPAEQTFRFRLREDPPTLDPALATDQLSEAVLFGLFRGLVEMDPGTLEVKPAIARSWTVSADRRTYTFTLRDEVRFHTGRAVGAADVEYSLKRLLSGTTNSPRRFIVEAIEGARDFIDGRSAGVAGLTTPDDRTVVIRLARPFAPFLGQLSMINASVVPREVYEDPGRAYLRAPVGCGPFRFVRWEQSNFIELGAFDAFYGGRPRLDRVLVRIIENSESALQEYLAGGLDSLDESPDPSEPTRGQPLAAEIHVYPFIGTGYIGFNHMLAPFKGNPALRKAFNHAVDKDYLYGTLMRGEMPARGVIPPGIPGHDPALPGYPYDPGAARRLLAEAGYPEGRGLPPIRLWFNTNDENRRIAQQVQADLSKVGVAITLNEVDWGAYLAAVEGTRDRPGQAQMFRFGWYLDYPDADAILRPLLHSANFGPPGNYFRYRNAAFDALLDQALDLTDPQARAGLYRKAERIAVMDDAAWLFLNHYISRTLFKPYVRGIVLSPLGEFRIPLERLSLDRDAS